MLANEAVALTATARYALATLTFPIFGIPNPAGLAEEPWRQRWIQLSKPLVPARIGVGTGGFNPAGEDPALGLFGREAVTTITRLDSYAKRPLPAQNAHFSWKQGVSNRTDVTDSHKLAHACSKSFESEVDPSADFGNHSTSVQIVLTTAISTL